MQILTAIAAGVLLLVVIAVAHDAADHSQTAMTPVPLSSAGSAPSVAGSTAAVVVEPAALNTPAATLTLAEPVEAQPEAVASTPLEPAAQPMSASDERGHSTSASDVAAPPARARPMPVVPDANGDPVDPRQIHRALTHAGYTVEDVWEIFRLGGLDESDWDHGFCIVWHESNFDPTNVGDQDLARLDPPRGPSLSWWQVDVAFWPGFNMARAPDPLYATRFVVHKIFPEGGDNPWHFWSTEHTFCHHLED